MDDEDLKVLAQLLVRFEDTQRLTTRLHKQAKGLLKAVKALQAARRVDDRFLWIP